MSVTGVGSPPATATSRPAASKPEAAEGSGPDRDGDRDDAVRATASSMPAQRSGIGKVLDISV
jgi:hypothetical protein